MDDTQRALARAATQGYTLHAAWVREWTKRPGTRRGHYRKLLKYYWMQDHLLHSGPFTSQADALVYLAHSTKTEDL